MNERYKVVAGSQSARCCFEYTVVDTWTSCTIGDRTRFQSMCECWDEEVAARIAQALNGLDP
jgi:hypothetical protein